MENRVCNGSEPISSKWEGRGGRGEGGILEGRGRKDLGNKVYLERGGMDGVKECGEEEQRNETREEREWERLFHQCLFLSSSFRWCCRSEVRIRMAGSSFNCPPATHDSFYSLVAIQ